MSEAEVQVVNSRLPKIAHIYWVPGVNWSSDLWKQLYEKGWRMVNNKGLYTVNNPDGREMFSAIGKVTTLSLLIDYLVIPPEKSRKKNKS